MSFVKIKFVNTTTATFTNNETYDVIAWGVQSGDAMAILVDDNGALRPVQASNPVDWELVSTVILEPKTLA